MPRWFSQATLDIQKKMNQTQFTGPKPCLKSFFGFNNYLVYVHYLWLIFSNKYCLTTFAYPDRFCFHNTFSLFSIIFKWCHHSPSEHLNFQSVCPKLPDTRATSGPKRYLWPFFTCWMYWLVGWMGGNCQQLSSHTMLSVVFCETERISSQRKLPILLIYSGHILCGGNGEPRIC